MGATESKGCALKPIIFSWLALAAWAGLIFFFSAQPRLSTGLGAWDLVMRKLAHMFVFGVLTFLAWRAIRQHGVSPGTALAVAAAGSLAYAISDEYHQSFVAGRSATAYDVGFDLGGILIAAALIRRRR